MRGDQFVQQAIEVVAGGSVAVEALQLGSGDHLGVGLGEDVDDERLGAK
jgi:hypothetical protein